MTVLTLSQLRREIVKIERDIKRKAKMPDHMDVNIPCRASVDLSPVCYDVVKVTVRLGDSVLIHFFRDGLTSLK